MAIFQYCNRWIHCDVMVDFGRFNMLRLVHIFTPTLKCTKYAWRECKKPSKKRIFSLIYIYLTIVSFILVFLLCYSHLVAFTYCFKINFVQEYRHQGREQFWTSNFTHDLIINRKYYWLFSNTTTTYLLKTNSVWIYRV